MRQGKSGPGLNSACPNPSPCWQWAIREPPDTPARGAAEVSQTLPAHRIRECRRSPHFSTTSATASVSREVHLASHRSYAISPGLGLPGRSAPARLLV